MKFIKSISLLLLITCASASAPAGDLENNFREEYEFQVLKFKHDNNLYHLNVPERIFSGLTDEKRAYLIEYLTELYGAVITIYAEIYGHAPEGYKFNVTFGKTAAGHPYNKVYAYTKTSNIFPDCLPYEDPEDVLTDEERAVMTHEVAHSLFAIKIGTFEHPKTKAIEEGFVDYITERAEGLDYSERRKAMRIPVTPLQAQNMKGLTQLDVEISMFGDNAVLNAPRDGSYAGFAHHTFGLEFIKAFISVFGEKALPGFMKRLRSVDRTPSVGDMGTRQIKLILKNMSYTDEQVQDFEVTLHSRLKEYVYGDGSPLHKPL